MRTHHNLKRRVFSLCVILFAFAQTSLNCPANTNSENASLQVELKALRLTNGVQAWTVAVTNNEQKAILVSADSIRSMLLQISLRDQDGNHWQAGDSKPDQVRSSEDDFLLIRSGKTFETTFETPRLKPAQYVSNSVSSGPITKVFDYCVDTSLRTMDFTSRTYKQRTCKGRGVVKLEVTGH